MSRNINYPYVMSFRVSAAVYDAANAVLEMMGGKERGDVMRIIFEAGLEAIANGTNNASLRRTMLARQIVARQERLDDICIGLQAAENLYRQTQDPKYLEQIRDLMVEAPRYRPAPDTEAALAQRFGSRTP